MAILKDGRNAGTNQLGVDSFNRLFAGLYDVSGSAISSQNPLAVGISSLSNSISVTNLPLTQSVNFPLTQSVWVSNFPGTQTVAGTVAISNFPVTQSVLVSNFPLTQSIAGMIGINNFPVTQSVLVSNFPLTQSVSGTVAIANFPANQPVTVSNFPLTQSIAGTVAISNFPVTQSVLVSNFPLTQSVSGTVAVANFPLTQSITFMPDVVGAVQTISVADTGSLSSSQFNGQINVTGIATPGSYALVPLNTEESLHCQLSGNFTGTFISEFSVDNGNTWIRQTMRIAGTSTAASTFTLPVVGTAVVGGKTHWRLRASSLSSGSASVRASLSLNPIAIYTLNAQGIADSSQSIVANVKGSLSAALSSDNALVVSLSPNSTGSVWVSNFPLTQSISGTVAIANFPATQNVTVSNFPVTQSVLVANFPVTQSVACQTAPPDQMVTGILASNGATVSMNTISGDSEWVAVISGTFNTGSTIVFEASANNQDYFLLNGRQTGIVNTVLVNTITGGLGPYEFRGNLAGMGQFRLRMSTFQTGDSATVWLRTSVGVGANFLNASIPAGNNTIGSVGVNGLGTPKFSQAVVTTASIQFANPALQNRQTITIEALQTNSAIVYIGSASNVTSSNGFPLFPGAPFSADMNSSAPFWAIAASGTQTLAIFEAAT